MNLFFMLRYLLRDANAGDGGGGTTPGDGAGDGDGDGDGDGGEGGEGGSGRTFTQAELDAILEKRLKRAEKKWQTDAEKRASEKDLSEVEKLKKQLEERDSAQAAKAAKAAKRAVAAEAKAQALAAGVDPKRVERFARLVDLSDVEIDDDGEFDTDEVSTAVTRILEEFPEFKAAGGQTTETTTSEKPSTKGGSSVGNNGSRTTGDKPLTRELIATMDSAELQRRMPEIKTFYEAQRK